MNRSVEVNIQAVTREVLSQWPAAEENLLLERTVREMLKFLCEAAEGESSLVSYVKRGEGGDGPHIQLLRTFVAAVKRDPFELEGTHDSNIEGEKSTMIWFAVNRSGLPEGWSVLLLGVSPSQIAIMGNFESAEVPCLIFDVFRKDLVTRASDPNVSFGQGRNEVKYYRDADGQVVGFEERFVAIKEGRLAELRTYHERVGEIELNKSIFDFLGLGVRCVVFCCKE